jgi:hypothetical protein
MKKLMFLMAAIVSLFAVSTTNAQSIKSYKFTGSTLQAGASLQPGQGLRSPGLQYAFVLQQDGNLCLYKMEKDAEKPIKCTMSIGSEDKKGARLDMQKDGNLVLYNNKGKAIWASDTYRGGPDKQGVRIWMSDRAGEAVMMTSQSGKTNIWNFEK